MRARTWEWKLYRCGDCGMVGFDDSFWCECMGDRELPEPFTVTEVPPGTPPDAVPVWLTEDELAIACGAIEDAPGPEHEHRQAYALRAKLLAAAGGEE